MLKATLKGTIIGGKRLPTQIDQGNRAFCYFYIRAEDFAQNRKERRDGEGTYQPTKTVQVILPDDKRRQKVFDHLRPGRTVSVDGDLTDDPKCSVDKQGEVVPHSNMMVRNARVQFMDLPQETQINQVLTVLQDTGTITEEQASEYLTTARTYLAEQDEKNPPRRYIDKTEKEPDLDDPFAE